MYLTQNSKTAYRIINEEAVIVDPSTSKLYSLNPLATLIWEMTNQRTCVEEIIDRIVEEFEVEREVAERDCQEFVSDFTGKGLLVSVEDLKEG